MPANATAPQTSSQPHATTQQRSSQVSFAKGILIVEATDASLNDILRNISRLTGLQVQGSVGNERVYGNYVGPVGDVVSRLLDGLPYDIVMTGPSVEQGPSQLVLTPRGSASASLREMTPVRPVPQPSQPQEEPNPGPPGFDAFHRQLRREMQARRRAAQANYPDGMPVPAPDSPETEAPGGDAGPGSQVRTPQELLQEMRRMHQIQPDPEAQEPTEAPETNGQPEPPEEPDPHDPANPIPPDQRPPPE